MVSADAIQRLLDGLDLTIWRNHIEDAQAALDALVAERDELALLRDAAYDERRAVEVDRDRYRAVLEQTEIDARWIVGQWQRLKDEPVKKVAIDIVERCRTALKESA